MYQHYKFCLQYRLIFPGAKLLVQISGGADSVCLARLCEAFKEKMPLETVWVHFNHKLRAGADGDENFVRQLAGQLRVPLTVYTRDTPFEDGSAQQQARQWRASVIDKLTTDKKIDRRLTGHHLDDLAETFFWRVARGTSLFGLKLMQPLDGDTARPLLYTKKQEITNYLHSIGQDWCEDETNRTTDYTRNRIRLQLIPALEAVFGDSYKEKIRDLSQDAAGLKNIIPPEFQQLVQQPDFPYRAVTNYPIVISAELIKRWLEYHNIIDVQRAKILKLCDLAYRNIGGREIEVGSGYSVYAKNKKFTLKKIPSA